MGKYSCTDCGKKFDQKSHYTAHKNKKIPCVVKDTSLKDYIVTKVKEKVQKLGNIEVVSDDDDVKSVKSDVSDEQPKEEKKPKTQKKVAKKQKKKEKKV